MIKLIKYAFLFVFLALISVYFFYEVAEAQSEVKVIFMKGSPKMMKMGGSQWEDCKLDMAIDNGDRIKTLKEESLELSFVKGDSNIVRVEENSDVVIKKTTSPYSIELLDGVAMSLIKNLPKDSTFKIKTPTAISGARGTGWESSTDGSRSTFNTFENSIYVKGIDKLGSEMEGELEVKSGFKTTVDKFEKPQALEKLSDKDIERWNSWKEDFDKRLEKRSAARNEMIIKTKAEDLEAQFGKTDRLMEAGERSRHVGFAGVGAGMPGGGGGGGGEKIPPKPPDDGKQ